MQPVSIGSVVLGADYPKICVSLTGKTIAALNEELSDAALASADLVEWRFDLQSDQSLDALAENLKLLKEKLNGLPLIFTLRTTREGGEGDYSDEAYHALYSAVINSGLADAIDLEGTRPDSILIELIALANKKHISVLLSYHNFEQTPANEVLQAFADKAAGLGTDLIKIAVMPKSKADVLRFMTFSQELSSSQNKPIITISMAQLGLVSRFGCSLTGSSMTFGVLKHASAPGQLPVQQLRSLLALMQN